VPTCIITNVVNSNQTQVRCTRYNIYDYVIKFVSDLRQVGGLLRFPTPIKRPPRYNWNIVESGVKHHNPYYKQKYKTYIQYLIWLTFSNCSSGFLFLWPPFLPSFLPWWYQWHFFNRLLKKINNIQNKIQYIQCTIRGTNYRKKRLLFQRAHME